MSKKTWIVVANSSQARLFSLEKGLKLLETDALVNPESRLHEGDLVSDHPGAARGGRYPMQTRRSAKEEVKRHFARLIASSLDALRNEGKIERIFLAAAPSLLGDLRQEFGAPLKHLVAGEVDKDITHHKPEEILGYFPIGL